LRRDLGRVGRGVFPPAQVAEVKALACELPAEQGVPLSRWSSAELAREAIKRGIVATIAAVTIWRWLTEDAIRPWNYRSWIFPTVGPGSARLSPVGVSAQDRAPGHPPAAGRSATIR
jgi:hypothetical protein